MTIEEEFNEWFDQQLADGLLDFKLNLHGACEGTTKEEVMAEILKLEKMIAGGEVEDFPPEPEPCHPGAEYIICSCIAGTPINQDRLNKLLDI